MAAQSISSVTNFTVAALALAAGDLASFGLFSIAFQISQVIIVIGQGSVGASVLVHTSEDADGSRAHDLRAGASTASVLLGVVAGAVVALGSLATGPTLRTSLLLAALGAPALVAQYQLRAQRFSRGDPAGALFADLVWFAVVAAAGIADLLGWWDPSTNAYFAVWLVGAAISGLPVIVVGLTSGWQHLRTFWATAGVQTVRMGIESALARSVFVTSLLTAQILISPEASGAIAAAVLVMSPMSVVHEALTLFLVPRLVSGSGIHVVRRSTLLKISGAVVAATIGWVIAVVLINVGGYGRGPFDLHANGVDTALFLATVLRFLALASWRGPQIALRTADATRQSLRARAIGTVAQWLLPILGFATGGIVWGALGIAVGTWIGVVVAFFEWKRLDDRVTELRTLAR